MQGNEGFDLYVYAINSLPLHGWSQAFSSVFSLQLLSSLSIPHDFMANIFLDLFLLPLSTELYVFKIRINLTR